MVWAVILVVGGNFNAGGSSQRFAPIRQAISAESGLTRTKDFLVKAWIRLNDLGNASWKVAAALLMLAGARTKMNTSQSEGHSCACK